MSPSLPPPPTRGGYLARQTQLMPVTMSRESMMRMHVGHDLRLLNLGTSSARVEPEWEDVTVTEDGEAKPTGQRRMTGRLTFVAGDAAPTTMIVCVQCGTFILDFMGTDPASYEQHLQEVRESPTAHATTFDEVRYRQELAEQEKQASEPVPQPVPMGPRERRKKPEEPPQA